MTTKRTAIRRDPLTKTAALSVAQEGRWALFAGKKLADIDFSFPVITGDGSGTVPLPLAASGWACFALVFESRPDAPVYLAERRLPMAGGFNFRDLGGFSGAAGKRVAWGAFFRTDGLSSLTDEDLAYLASIPITTLVDFRTAEEGGRSPDRVPPSVKNVLSLPIAPGYMNPEAEKGLEDYESPDAFMLHMYEDLVLDKGITAAYRKFFASVQRADEVPILFHCSAGKDRTGIAAALILSSLGVDREAILADYESSNGYLEEKYALAIEQKPYLRGLLTVKRLFLESAFDLAEREYGSIENYLETGLSVDIDVMRRRFLI